MQSGVVTVVRPFLQSYLVPTITAIVRTICYKILNGVRFRVNVRPSV